MKIALAGPDEDGVMWIEVRAANGLAAAWSASKTSINGRTLAAGKVELAGSVELAAVYPRLEIDIIGSGTPGVAADLGFQRGIVNDLRTAASLLAPRACPGALEMSTAKTLIERVLGLLSGDERTGDVRAAGVGGESPAHEIGHGQDAGAGVTETPPK